MNKLLLICLLTSWTSGIAQEMFFLSGKNFTKFSFSQLSSSTTIQLQAGSGNYYEVGIATAIEDQPFFYSTAINLQEFNAIGGDAVSKYTWNSQYIGAKIAAYYPLLTSHCNCYNETSWNVLVLASLNAITLVDGQQTITSSYYNTNSYFDLKKNAEFTGLFLQPSLGLQVKYSMFSYGAVSVGYSYNQAFNLLNNTTEKLGFNSHQLQFGIHLNTP
jgi:hypothetical protein